VVVRPRRTTTRQKQINVAREPGWDDAGDVSGAYGGDADGLRPTQFEPLSQPTLNLAVRSFRLAPTSSERKTELRSQSKLVVSWVLQFLLRVYFLYTAESLCQGSKFEIG